MYMANASILRWDPTSGKTQILALGNAKIYQHVGISNVKFWRRGHCPTPTPDARYFALQWIKALEVGKCVFNLSDVFTLRIYFLRMPIPLRFILLNLFHKTSNITSESSPFSVCIKRSILAYILLWCTSESRLYLGTPWA